MAVSKRLREIESEIDDSIRELKTWQGSKAAVLEDLMRTYRDTIEVVFVELMHAEVFDSSPEDFGKSFGNENRIRAGILWALKWALEYCPEGGAAGTRSPKGLVNLMFLGAIYETFVDVLKYAQYGLITIRVDEASRTIICYEGDQVTAFDTEIVEQERISTPTTPHFSLTEDGDQLTSRWKAGDYRRVMRSLADYAASQENRIQVNADFLKKIGKPAISVAQPTVVWLDRPTMTPDCHVFDDLVLPAVMDSQLKWRLVSLLDTPIVNIKGQYCALSSDLKTLWVIDDYMLRLAARVDERQYSLANVLREGRMIKTCRQTLESCSRPWTTAERVRYVNPPQEVDVLATRATERVILELKSTLRPETPWEVYKRNEDLISGIRQTRALVDRGIAGHGFLVTDGYRGDYVCWAEALSSGISIATLYDLDVIADDPIAAGSHVKSLVGITGTRPKKPKGLPERETNLLHWKLRLVDRAAPDDEGP
jgi:hypothetical protein